MFLVQVRMKNVAWNGPKCPGYDSPSRAIIQRCFVQGCGVRLVAENFGYSRGSMWVDIFPAQSAKQMVCRNGKRRHSQISQNMSSKRIERSLRAIKEGIEKEKEWSFYSWSPCPWLRSARSAGKPTYSKYCTLSELSRTEFGPHTVILYPIRAATGRGTSMMLVEAGMLGCSPMSKNTEQPQVHGSLSRPSQEK